MIVCRRPPRSPICARPTVVFVEPHLQYRRFSGRLTDRAAAPSPRPHARFRVSAGTTGRWRRRVRWRRPASACGFDNRRRGRARIRTRTHRYRPFPERIGDQEVRGREPSPETTMSAGAAAVGAGDRRGGRWAPKFSSIAIISSRASVSSSTIENRDAFERDRLGARRRARRGAPRSSGTAGRLTQNVAPCLTPPLSTPTVPPCSSTICRTSESPRPSPPWRRLARRRPGGSDRTRTAGSPARCPGRCRGPYSRTVAALARDLEARRAPPASVNFTAFDSRFQTTCCRRSASPLTAGRSGVERGLDRDAAWRRRPARRRRSPPARRRSSDTASMFEPQLAADDARHVEQILDQPHLRRGVALDDLERMRARAHRRLRSAGSASSRCTALSGVRISCDSVARNSSFSRDASSASCARLIRGGNLVAQLALGDHPLGDVLDQGDRADDRAARLRSGSMRAVCAISVRPAPWKLRVIGSRYL